MIKIKFYKQKINSKEVEKVKKEERERNVKKKD